MNRFVLVVEGAAPQAEIALEPGEKASVGRAEDARVRLSEDDKKVSRYHAILEARADGIVVRDLGSRNGTYLNDARVEIVTMQDGDRLRIGHTTLRARAVAVVPYVSSPAVTEDEDSPVIGLEATAISMVAPPVEGSCGVCDAPCRARTPSPWPDARLLCDRCLLARRAMATGPSDRQAIGPFEVVRFLAAGGMGMVYETRHKDSGVHAAVKVLRSDTPLPPPFARRFVKEQKIVTRLSHPNIVRAYEAALDPSSGEPYIATEFVMGGEAERLASPSCDVRLATAIAADLFDALAYGHSQGFLHRDVKPANVLLAPDAAGRLHGKLNDFGLAKSFLEAGGTSITEEGEMAGSALFMAPEQLLHFKTVGPSADVYGAAATLYCLLTTLSPLKLPVPEERASMQMACVATLDSTRVNVRALRPDLPPALADLIDRLVARDPAFRVSTPAATVGEALRRMSLA